MTGTTHVLDNAVWFALNGPHETFAEGNGAARRYHPDVSVFHGAPDNSSASWSALEDVATDGVVVLFRGVPVRAPDNWRTLQAGDGFQLVFDGDPVVPPLPAVDPETGSTITLRALTNDDVAEMTALVDLTKPGPFRPRTIELGGYVGIFHDEQLVAMAGQRLRPPGYCEISAVCTHPDARRRGYASIVTLHVAAAIAARGERPFLHVAATNTSAKSVYEKIGFKVRREVPFAALSTAPPL
jgi:ribosomal protein S18 acetylase RimI-like enzyme